MKNSKPDIRRPKLAGSLLCALLAFACSTPAPEAPPAPPPTGEKAFVGATILDGTGAAPIVDGVLIVKDGKIRAIGPASDVVVSDGAERIDVSGRTLMPGIINAHGHVGATLGLKSAPEFYTDDNVARQLGLYARYGVTTVVSLGDDGDAGFHARNGNGDPGLDRARIFVAGPVITAADPEAARLAVDAIADRNPDFIKIRVDDNLGTAEKMTPAVYRAVIAQAHARGMRVAAHVYYLADAKALLEAGADYLAHSIRDREVDARLIELMKARSACLSPTLMREVSTFVYESRPAFFDDLFFLREVEPSVVTELLDPARQAEIAKSRAAQIYKKQLAVARRNAKALRDAGVRLASGTDTGLPGRFQGYFEHLELEELVKAGLTPMQAIVAATGDAAACVGLADRVGTLRPGLAADVIVLGKNPLDEIRNTSTIEAVYVNGNRVARN
jgi:imidazolonepropionase-like amidohydrolase